MTAPKRGLRRNLTAYGDEEFSLFLRRAFIKAMGYTDDALERPIIGITKAGSTVRESRIDYASLTGRAPLFRSTRPAGRVTSGRRA